MGLAIGSAQRVDLRQPPVLSLMQPGSDRVQLGLEGKVPILTVTSGTVVLLGTHRSTSVPQHVRVPQAGQEALVRRYVSRCYVGLLGRT